MKEKNYFCWLSQRVKNTRGATYAQPLRNAPRPLYGHRTDVGGIEN